MKKILLLTSVVALLTTTGCLVTEGGGHGGHRGHGRHGGHPTIMVPAPVVVVPVIRVH